jgi:sugar phosphate isomerase/epimerase
MKYRNIFRAALILWAAITSSFFLPACSGENHAPDSRIGGVQIGAITYSWRSMPGTPEDIIRYCKQTGISTIELMGEVAETWAGAPARQAFPEHFRELSPEERAAHHAKWEGLKEKTSEWRTIQASPEMYRELRRMFDEAGITIHLVKFAPARWSDAEIDYAFESAKILGAEGVSDEIGHEACARLAPFAEKHDMYAVFHNHEQPGDTAFRFEDYLHDSPRVMLNFDAGHYFGASGKHPNAQIEKLHERIFSIHLKDKTGPDADPPDTNMPWGEGDTPLDDVLKLIQEKGWDIICDIEFEYEVPEGSDAVQETAKCLEYCRNVLL